MATINGGNGDDTLTGTTANDVIEGGSGADTLEGGAGADYVDGGAGADNIDGGTEDDTLHGNVGDDTIAGGDGDDDLLGGSGDDSLAGDAGADTISGGAGADTISGGDGDDVISGGDIEQPGTYTAMGFEFGQEFTVAIASLGDSSLDGAQITGEAKAITFIDDDGALSNDPSSDRFAANDATQQVLVNGVAHAANVEGITTLTGSDGKTYEFAVVQVDLDDDDVADGNTSEQGHYIVPIGDAPPAGVALTYVSVDARSSIDYSDLAAPDAVDTDDAIDGGAGDDTIDGGAGADTLLGNIGADSVDGGAGDDVIEGGSGADTLEGGAGADYVDGGAGADNIDGGTEDDTLHGNVGDDTIAGGDGDDDLLGGSGDDSLAGDAGADTISGGAGADTISGGDGDDVISGGDIEQPGTYTAMGFEFGQEFTVAIASLGDSSLDGAQITGEAKAITFIDDDGALSNDPSSDRFAANDATQQVLVNGVAHAANVEGITTLTGSDGKTYEFAVVQVDLDDDDVADGNTSEQGHYIVPIGDAPPAGVALTYVSVDARSSIDYSDLVAPDAVDTDDAIDGGAGDDTIDGGAGADTLLGNIGADSVDGGAGDDVIEGGSGADTLEGGAGADYVDGGAGADNIDGGTEDDTLHGNVGDDTIAGGDGDDDLLGGSGDDSLAGDAGADTISGGAGADTISGGDGDDVISGGDIEQPGTYTAMGFEFGQEFTASNAQLTHGNLTNVGIIGDAKEIIFIDDDGVLHNDTITEKFAANDSTQQVLVNGVAHAANIETLHTLSDVDGNTYQAALVQVDLDDDDGVDPNTSEHGHYLVFIGAVPPAGVTLAETSHSSDDDVNYSDLVAPDAVDTDDAIDGGAGDDTIDGGAGADTLLGNIGADSVDGGAGDDVIEGGSGADTLEGGAGADYVDGGAGADNIDGGTEDDTLHGNVGDDTIAGGDGDDDLLGGSGDDSLAGDAGADTISGGAGADTISGGDGDDVISGGDIEQPGTYTAMGFEFGQEFTASNAQLTHGNLTNVGIIGDAKEIIFIDDDGVLHNDTITEKFAANDSTQQVLVNGVAHAANIETLHTLSDVDGNTYQAALVQVDLDDDDGVDPNTSEHGHYLVFIGAVPPAGVTLAETSHSSDDDVNYSDLVAPDAVDTDDAIDGGAGDDTIDGGAGADTLLGNIGADSVDGGAGDDVIEGGSGADTLEGGAGADYVDGGAGADNIDGGTEDDTLHGNVGDDTIAGGDGDDDLLGGSGDDSLAGDAGADTISGGAGADTISGGDGDDVISGGDIEQPGTYTAMGFEFGQEFTASNAQLTHGNLTNVGIIGDAKEIIFIDDDGVLHNDTITEKFAANDSTQQVLVNGVAHAANIETLHTLSDVDGNTYQAALVQVDLDDDDGVDPNTSEHGHYLVFIGAVPPAGVTLAETSHSSDDDVNYSDLVAPDAVDTDDAIDGGAGDDTIDGGAGADTLLGNIGADSVDGGAGDDVIEGGSGADTLEGGAGADYVDGGAGADNIDGGTEDDTLHGNVGDDTIAGGDGDDDLLGGSGDDSLAGDAGADTISGGAGADTISGGDGDDVISGGDIEQPGTYTAMGFEFGQEFTASNAQLTHGNLTNVGIIGDAKEIIFIDDDGVLHNDTITEKFAANDSTQQVLVNGVAHAANIETLHTLSDVDGNTYQAALVQVDLDDDDGVDPNTSEHGHYLVFIGAVPPAGVTLAETSHSSDDDVNYSDLVAPDAVDTDDAIDGGAGDDTIDGGAGADTLLGNIGADSVDGGAGDDVIEGGSGADTLEGGAGADYVDGGAGADNIDGGTEDDTLHGNVGDDTIAGGDGDDDLLGGSGDDSLAGDAGADTISGGAGADTISGGDGDDVISGGDIEQPGTYTAMGFEFGQEFTASNAQLTHANLHNVGIIGDAKEIIFIDDDGVLSNDPSSDRFAANDATQQVLVNGVAHAANIESIHTLSDVDGNTYQVALVQVDLDDDDGVDPNTSEQGHYLVSIGAVPPAGVTLVETSASYGSTVNYSDLAAPDAVDTDDAIDGGAGDDTIDGGAGADTLLGNIGADSVDGGAGDDVIEGGSGADTLEGGAGADYVDGGAGADNIDGGTEDDTLHGNVGDDTIAGGDGDDDLLGGSGDDSLAGDAGADTISGGAGADTISGGDGDDVISGGDIEQPGTYTAMGFEFGQEFTASNAQLTHANLHNVGIIGDAKEIIFIDDDGVLSNDPSSDRFAANDATQQVLVNGVAHAANIESIHTLSDVDGNTYQVALVQVDLDDDDGVDPNTSEQGHYLVSIGAVPPAGVTLAETSASYGSTVNYSDLAAPDAVDTDDEIDGGAGDDTIDGGAGADTLLGNIGADSVDGGAGDDVIEGGSGADTLEGGAGADYVDGGAGADNIDGGTEDDTLHGNVGDDTIAGGDGDDDLLGGSGDDSLAGDAGADTISGGAGADTISGGDGDDVISGGDIEQPGTYTAMGFEFGQEFTASNAQLTHANLHNVGIIGDAKEIIFIDDDGVLSNDPSSDRFAANDATQQVLVNGVAHAANIESIHTLSDVDGNTYQVALVQVDLDDDDGVDPNTSEQGHYLVSIGAVPPAGVTLAETSASYGSTVNYSDLAAPDAVDTDDEIDGGAGDDTIDGGAGADTIDGGDGSDNLTGGDADDVFVVSDGNDTISDFNAGNTGALNDGDNTNNDFVNLSGHYDHISELYADQADDGILNQSNATDTRGNAVDYSDNTQFGANSLTISGASADSSSLTSDNTGVVCFASGTAIRTPHGDVPVEELKMGDLVLTADNGYRALDWIGSRKMSKEAMSEQPNLTPIRIKANALANGVPERDLVVSPQHRIFLNSKIAARIFDEPEVLVAAKHLLQVEGVDYATDMEEVEYFHFLFDRHEVVYANGALSESLYTGPEAIKALSQEARQEIFAIFPELFERDYRPDSPARPIVSGRQARKMAARHKKNAKPLVHWQ